MVTALTAGLRASTRSIAASRSSSGITSLRRPSCASLNASYCSYSANPHIFLPPERKVKGEWEKRKDKSADRGSCPWSRQAPFQPDFPETSGTTDRARKAGLHAPNPCTCCPAASLYGMAPASRPALWCGWHRCNCFVAGLIGWRHAVRRDGAPEKAQSVVGSPVRGGIRGDGILLVAACPHPATRWGSACGLRRERGADRHGISAGIARGDGGRGSHSRRVHHLRRVHQCTAPRRRSKCRHSP